MTIAIIAAILGAWILGIAVGYSMRPFLSRNTLPITEVQKQMAAAVEREESEHLRRQRAISLQRSKKRTMRVDGGPPARVHRMRKRTNVIRRPIDRI